LYISSQKNNEQFHVNDPGQFTFYLWIYPIPLVSLALAAASEL